MKDRNMKNSIIQLYFQLRNMSKELRKLEEKHRDLIAENTILKEQLNSICSCNCGRCIPAREADETLEKLHTIRKYLTNTSRPERS